MKTRYIFNGLLVQLVVLFFAVASPQLINAQDAQGNAKKDDAKQTTPEKEESKKLSDNFKFFVEVGGQFRSLSGERPTKFEEYGETPEGFWGRRFSVSSEPAGSPNYFRAMGRDIAEDDQQYLLEVGQYGLFKTKFEWKEFSHLYSRGARSLFRESNGVLTIDDSIQTTLQNTPYAALPAAVQGYFNNASVIDVKTNRNSLNFTQSLQINQAWSVKFNWNRQTKTGNRAIGSGSYERVGTPIGDTFRVHSIELPAPVDSVTDNFTLGTSYLKKNWGFSFDYIYSKFSNDINAIVYDNPFRITDLQATGSGGVNDRMKMATSQLASEPDNTSQSFNVSAFVDLPRETRLAAALGWSFWKQDEAFLPYTLNTAIVTGVPVGLNITSTSSLPEKSLSGDVEIFTQDYLIASRPWKNWTFNAHYRRYEDENKSSSILFPGYVAYLDSYWRSNIATVPIENEVQSYTRTNVTGEAIWDMSKKFRLKLGYEWEGWLREHRQTTDSDEQSVYAQFSYNPTSRFTSKLNYRYSDRNPGYYDPGLKEFSQLRMFDQARRLRHDVDFQWQFAVNSKIGLSGTLGGLSDDYDQHYFGLVRYKQGYGGFDILYMPKENTTLYFNFSRESYTNSMQTIAKTAAPYDLNNRWDRDERNTLDNFGMGITTYLAKDKVLLDMHYVYSNGKTNTKTLNPGTPAANSVLNATAYPLTDVKTRYQELNTDLSYQFNDNVALGFRYIYQPYDLNDFALNGLSPYPYNLFGPDQDATRFLLLDSRYTTADAHIFGVYLRFGK